jgi:hypothetical protein
MPNPRSLQCMRIKDIAGITTTTWMPLSLLPPHRVRRPDQLEPVST